MYDWIRVRFRVRLVRFIYVVVRRVKQPYSIEEKVDYPLQFQDLPCLFRIPVTHLRVISSTVKRRPSNAGDKLFAAPRVIHVKRGLWIRPHDFAQQSRLCKSRLVVRSNSRSTWWLMEPKTRKIKRKYDPNRNRSRNRSRNRR